MIVISAVIVRVLDHRDRRLEGRKRHKDQQGKHSPGTATKFRSENIKRLSLV